MDFEPTQAMPDCLFLLLFANSIFGISVALLPRVRTQSKFGLSVCPQFVGLGILRFYFIFFSILPWKFTSILVFNLPESSSII